MTAQEKTKTPKWTIMVYIAADDTLANFAVGSLLQLIRVASQNDDVVVTAQFDADGQRDIPILVFESTGGKREPINSYSKGTVARGTPMTDPLTLTRFINWTYTRYQADHYCLVLWGHGPELLIEDSLAGGNSQSAKKFLTPADLRTALAGTELAKAGGKLDLVAIDACCMSAVEVACELPAYADFLVASQDEVPDFSFPYDQVLVFGKRAGSDGVKRLCEEIPRRYVRAYQDYILTEETDIPSITLSSLSLCAIETVTRPLRRLASALLREVHDEKTRQAVIAARAKYPGYVAGLYTDLYEFCDQLQRQLVSANIPDEEINSACEEIRAAIDARGDKAVVVENQAPQDQRCRGISIYFPYWIEPDQDITESPRPETVANAQEKNRSGAAGRVGNDAVSANRTGAASEVSTEAPKGGLDVPRKGGLDVPRKGGLDVPRKEALNKARRQRIQETEQYYGDLRLSKETRWDEFIRYGWSRWLAEEVETKMKSVSSAESFDSLDRQYSAQQCAVNLLSLCCELEKEQKASADQGMGRPSDGKSSVTAGR